MKTLLAELSIPDLLLLTGLGDKPLFSLDTLTNESLQQCFDWIRGRRNWTKIAEESLRRSDARRALLARCKALAAGEKILDEVEAQLHQVWDEHHARERDYRRRIAALPVVADARELYTEVATARRESSQILTPSESPPNSPSEIERAFDGWSKLEKLAADADLLVQLLIEHTIAQRRRLLESVRASMDSLFTQFADPISKSSDERILMTLRAIPELMRAGAHDLLEKVRTNAASLTDEFVSELVARCRLSVVSLRELHVHEPAALPTALPAIQLTAASQTIFSAEPPALRGLFSVEDLEAQRAEVALVIDELDAGTRWMRIARATAAEELQRLALGQALTLLAQAYMDREQVRVATELARDAVIALCLPRSWFREELFDSAAMTLVATRTWARMNMMSSLSGRPSLLAGRPDRIFTWLRDNDAVDLVAELWADLPDDVDDCFLGVLLVHFAHAIELRYACGEAALTATRLKARPITTARRILRLLDESAQSEQLTLALHACATEIDATARTSIGEIARQILMKHADTVRRLLCGRTDDPIAVVIGSRFSDLVNRIASADSHGGEAKLSISPAVGIFYPRERCDDVWLPIMVSNERTGGPASEMNVQVSYEGPVDNWRPEIERAEFNVPLLNPDDSYTGYALLQIHEEAAAHHAAWQFRVSLLRGADVIQTRNINVNVRERNYRRPNPFSAGQAVDEDQFFVGREKEIGILLDSLCADRRDITPIIVGLRRIGKTSLLKRLLRHKDVLEKYETHFWDMQDLQNRCTTSHFLFQLASRVREKLPEGLRARIPFPRATMMAEYKEDPYLAFEKFCDAVAQLSLKKLILVGIDEFEQIVGLLRNTAARITNGETGIGPHNAFEPQTLGALRKMLMSSGSVRLVFSGLPEILTRVTYDDRLFGLLRPVEVGPFEESEADRVVDQAEGFVHFPRRVRTELFSITGLQPYLLQVLCSQIYARVSSSGRDQVTSLDLRESVDRDILPKESYFVDYVKLIRMDDRPLLRALALAQKAVMARRQFVAPSEVVLELWKAGISTATVDGVRDRLKSLAAEERPLVAESRDYRGNFRLVIGLLTDRLVARGT